MPNNQFVDEMCICGHLKSSHNDSLQGLAEGHGDCKVCNCEKFTWERFVTKEELGNETQ